MARFSAQNHHPTIAIVIDATVVRGLLVPATMRLLGAANWRAPAPLRRAWERFGFREEDEPGRPVPSIEQICP